MVSRCTAVFLLGIFFSCSSQSTLASTDDYKNYQQCRKTCQDFFDTELDKKFCQSALNQLPRPGVYKACMNGILYGFKASCVPACLLTEEAQKDEQSLVPDSFNACKRESGKASPNNGFTWCRSSYDIIFNEMKALMVKKSTKELQQNTIIKDKEGRHLEVTSNSFEKEYEDSMTAHLRSRNSDSSIDTDGSADLELEDESADNSEDIDGNENDSEEDDENVDDKWLMETTKDEEEEEGFYMYNPPNSNREDGA